MMMILILISTTIFVAILFSVGFITSFFKIPTNKFPFSFSSVKATPLALDTTTTNKDKEELKGVFATFDKNDDGFITKQELKDSLMNIGIFMEDRDIAEMMEKVDENGDGLIDVNEFYELCNSLFMSDEREEKDLTEAFEVFDGNTDGLITAEELSKVIASLGLKEEGKTLEDCKEMIRRFDLDGDGMVNFDEFSTMMSSISKSSGQ